MATNWAGNYRYRARRILRPTSLAELQAAVAASDRIRALGSGHSFSDLGDSPGELVLVDGLHRHLEIDSTARAVSVGAGLRYGELAEELHRNGWALSNLASLPHISVAGAVATGTHGSGDSNGTLAAAVRAFDLVGPGGEVRTIDRGSANFEGSVVALGALGVVTRLELEIQPTFDVASAQYGPLGWDEAAEHFDQIMAAAYSVSLFTRWSSCIDQIWLKARSSDLPGDLYGAQRFARTVHMLDDAPADAVTEQHAVPGPWHQRLPHFRMEFTPSRGEEIQSEYFLPRDRAIPAFAELRRIARRFGHLLQVSEIRTVAADDLWLSGSYERDSVAVHFTWVRDQSAIAGVLPLIESVLLPLGARPHWGKCFAAEAEQLGHAFRRLADFSTLCVSADPASKFSNRFLDVRLPRPGRNKT